MITLKELADKVNGKLIGDGSIAISTVDDLKSASNKSITFAFLPKFKKEISSSSAGAFIFLCRTKEDSQKDFEQKLVEVSQIKFEGVDSLYVNNVLPLYFASMRQGKLNGDYTQADGLLESLKGYQNKYGLANGGGVGTLFKRKR